MEKEIEVAARWWTDCLSTPKPHDNGDALQSLVFTWLSQPQKPLTSRQLEIFEESLRHKMRVKFHGNWNMEDPMWGSYSRTIGVDYGPDPILREAASSADFYPERRFPIKTMMWIDPGSVRVAQGYSAPSIVLWSATPEVSES